MSLLPRKARSRVAPYLLALPAALLACVFVFGVANGVAQGFGIMPFLGMHTPTLEYYEQVFAREDLLSSLLYSLYLALVSSLIALVGGVILAHSIVALPYAMSIMCDVTRAAGRRMEEASLTCGAGRLSTLVHATLPSLAPGIASSLLMCYILSFSQYFLTLLIGGGTVRTFALVLFPYLGGGDRTIAGAYGIVFIAVTLTVFLVFELLIHKLRAVEETAYYES